MVADGVMAVGVVAALLAGQQARNEPAVQAMLPEPMVQVEVGSDPSQQDTSEYTELL